uniref:Uncharacterized protein n=1 Tax=Rhizophora mucronata TaxID=61149 RepID=A0A2P2MFX1_RHIMU
MMRLCLLAICEAFNDLIWKQKRRAKQFLHALRLLRLNI